jgi:hypothetical protein
MKDLLKALCILALTALQACAGAQPLTLDMSGRELTFSKSGTYDLIVLEGAAMTTVVGAPSVPAVAVNVVVPQDMRVTGVTCGPAATDDVEGSFLIIPAQPPQPMSASGKAGFVPPDPAIYNSDAPYPAELGELSGQNSMQGYNVVSLLVYPLQYSPKNRTAKFHRKLTLSFAMAPADLGYLPVGQRSKERREAIEDDVRSVVVNPDDVSRFAPKEQ